MEIQGPVRDREGEKVREKEVERGREKEKEVERERLMRQREGERMIR